MYTISGLSLEQKSRSKKKSIKKVNFLTFINKAKEKLDDGEEGGVNNELNWVSSIG